MIWFHIPLKSHWQMPLENSPMAGFQRSSLQPLLPLTELPLLQLMLIYSAVFLPVSAWVKGDAFIDGYYGNTRKLKISRRTHCAFPSPYVLPETNWLPNLAVWKKNVLWLAFLEAESKAAQVLFCYSARKTSQVYVMQTRKENEAHIVGPYKYFCRLTAFMF